MTELRSSREAGVCIRVLFVTPSLRRVVEGTQLECLKDTFVGPTPIA